ncbi:hypothetical protein J4N45_10635 [Vibrio sp. SCSIO 43140]|uniref:hypothetical protein n=1 Tax=Vibrio sp. SCSIO 43140 TaxID=2819100 RepID=UPI002074CDBB|nr:hypothetical protein [Vibrio sp. SCSIO 43140]USD58987.1 hypothetical protein J4N45_10635 [Vibrio sp. SCSIO 43140]
MTKYKAELHSAFSSKTVEFETEKTGVALVRLAKKKLNCTGFKLQLAVHSGDHKQWVSPDFSMTLNPLT